jgi:glutathione synthase/RimK-type ligase-like ATP-grasp enzyme
MLLNPLLLPQPPWRSHERAGAEHAFGRVVDLGPASLADWLEFPPEPGPVTVRWFPPSEALDAAGWQALQATRAVAGRAAGHINDVQHWPAVHDKVECFRRWDAAGVPIPAWRTWEPGGFAAASEGLAMPLLLRLNNGVAGQDSWLVRTAAELPAALAAVEAAYAQRAGAINRLLATQFIETAAPDCPLNTSYRIIVAGGRVITGYARVSDRADWVAVTNKFHAELADAWVAANRRCQRFMVEHAAELVRAVAVLGLNHQGVDVIEDGATGQRYYLEVQTTYDAGFIGCGAYAPPFYNPYHPELVAFLTQNRGWLETELPLYCHGWLDKAEHFRQCYAALADSLKRET